MTELTSPVVLPSITFVGAGSMARAIIHGLCRPGITVEGGVRATNRSASSADTLRALPGVTVFSLEETPDANTVAVAGVDVIVIAVKPFQVRDVLTEIAPALSPHALVISVASGVSTATFEQLLPDTVAVIRSMPNTPALVGRAVTGLSAGSRCTDNHMDIAQRLFETVGTVVVVPESNLDALSTISGSGPAYVFYLIEQFAAAAQNLGFSADQAAALVYGTFAGSTELLLGSNESPHELRRQVTSPGGTTERAIAVFESADLESLFTRATQAALERARELAGDS